MAEGPLPVDALGPNGKTVDKGQVVVMDNQVDQTTGTVKLKAEFPNANLQLWPGQFVNVRLLIETLSQVVVVPTAAIQRGPTGTYVYVVKDDNTVTVRPVTVKLQNDRQAVIEEGVRKDEVVVTSGFGRLREGERVTVESAESTGQVGASAGKGKRAKSAAD
jgi:multidrug efflux system membrane fusion protein